VCYDLIFLELRATGQKKKRRKGKEALKLRYFAVRQVVSVTPLTDVIIKRKKAHENFFLFKCYFLTLGTDYPV
jgi:hypothetical protein